MRQDGKNCNRNVTRMVANTRSSWMVLASIFLIAIIAICDGARVIRSQPNRHQVCIWGAGASGMFAAVSLADAGYTDLMIFDSYNGVGGQCDTVRTETTWEEAGVMVYPDTALANQLGFGQWNVDVAAIVKRFAGQDSIIETTFTGIPTYVSWADQGIILAGPVADPPPTAEFLEALARFKQIMSTRLFWMDTLDNVPNPIPQELTLTLSQWIDLNNLTALKETFFGSGFFYGGIGNLDNITAFDGLMQKTATDLLYGEPGAWFSVKNGCQSVFDGMRAYLGESSFKLGSTIESIKRPRSDRSARPIVISGKQNGVDFVERCERLIVAVPPTLDNLTPLNLTQKELSLFASVKSKYMYTGIMHAAGGTLANLGTGHLMINVDPYKPGGRPSLPNLLISYRKFATGPIVYQSLSEEPITDQNMKAVTDAVLAKLSQGGIYTNITGAVQWRHQFNPTWSREVLSQSIAPQNRLDDLNGHLRTFYVGSLRSTANSMIIWHQTKKVVDRWFVEDAQSNDEDYDTYSQRSLVPGQEDTDHPVASDASKIMSFVQQYL